MPSTWLRTTSCAAICSSCTSTSCASGHLGASGQLQRCGSTSCPPARSRPGSSSSSSSAYKSYELGCAKMAAGQECARPCHMRMACCIQLHVKCCGSQDGPVGVPRLWVRRASSCSPTSPGSPAQQGTRAQQVGGAASRAGYLRELQDDLKAMARGARASLRPCNKDDSTDLAHRLT